jgi:flagellar biosynthesis/type III secretory pathway M-ring protein FliF/YscJ|tara:strand:+ start:61 stop:579 length:519 start_codon:yes stop_codon:yes gene_type:complete
LINISISKEQTKQILLVAFLVVCVALAILILVWAEEPERRPLIQNIQLVDAVKIIDALEASKISYVTRLDSQMILVRDEDMDHARLALARIGIVIDYPDVRQMANASEACDILETKIYEHTNNPNTPITEKPYFLKLVKLMMGTLIIMVLILTVIRPALINLLEKFDDKDEP